MFALLYVDHHAYKVAIATTSWYCGVVAWPHSQWGLGLGNSGWHDCGKSLASDFLVKWVM